MMKKLFLISLTLLLVLSLVGCGGDSDDDLEDVNEEEIEVESEEDDLDIDESEENEEEKDEEDEEDDMLTYVLFLFDSEGDRLVSNPYTISKNDEQLDNMMFEEYIINRLISQESDDFVNPIPRDTRINKIDKVFGNIEVDLSEEFLNGLDSVVETQYAITMIVNSITLLEGNETVTILIDGEPVDNVNGVPIPEEISHIDTFFGDK